MEAMKNDHSQEEEVKGFFRFFKIFVATKTIIRSYRHSNIPIWLMMLLASIAGTGWIYEGYFSEYMGNHIPFPFILLQGAGYGILAGNMILFFGVLIIKWLGRLFRLSNGVSRYTQGLHTDGLFPFCFICTHLDFHCCDARSVYVC